MNTYKITNITNLTAKRDRKHNTTINIEYVDKMVNKIITVKPNATVYLTVSSLPLSVHRLRIKNLITVIEVDSVEVVKSQKKIKTLKVRAIKIGDTSTKARKKITTAKTKLTKKVIE